jgi:ABC-type uncharacterized transport system ATPase subunit
MTPAVEMTSISRRFGAVQALENVSLTVQTGEIHALVGENGAGKTTLMRILYGSDQPDAGDIRIDGKPVHFANAAQGIAAGIGMVSQHYSIIPELTCLQNLMLGAEPSAVIDQTSAEALAQKLADQMGFKFDWHALAETLSPASAQKLEILKLLWRKARIMILDEPTAMLSPADSDALFASLRQLAAGGATIIVVTHRLPEVLEFCSRVTVLRAGRLIEARDVQGTTASQLAELIVGKAVNTDARPTSDAMGEAQLVVESLVAKGYRGDAALKGVSFSVRKGEILGIAGVDGSGQRELFWAICGLLKPDSGSILWRGQPLHAMKPGDRLRQGLRLIPEDRHAEGVVDSWPLEENAAIGLQRHSAFRQGAWLRRDARRTLAERMARRFNTRFGTLQSPMASLSGGNQQRFVAARALEIEPGLILAFQPARGLDIEATRQVYEGIAEACRNGASALVVSFDLDELINQCDRVVALCGGQLNEAPPELTRDRAAIGRLMVGASA